MSDISEDTSFTSCLTSFGLSRPEAQIYAVLLSHGAMTGYEVSKETGISRSNVYAALQSLAEKGAACLIQGEAARYTAVPVREFTENTMKALGEKAEYLATHTPERRIEADGYITIQGDVNIRNRMRRMLSETQHRLYLLAPSSVMADFAGELEALLRGGKKVVLLTDGADHALLHRLGALFAEEGRGPHPHGRPPLPGAAPRGKPLPGEHAPHGRPRAASESALYVTETEPGEIRFITDSEHVLTGTLTGSTDDTCLFSGQRNLVSVMKEALKNKITLLKLNGIAMGAPKF
ncbi:MAG: TrmB family transcriptional regulator [Treponema sp.]|nr:TrmB family transcriptional regulator [Candidatus Treponema caballi]